jgi:hypothetical protein
MLLFLFFILVLDSYPAASLLLYDGASSCSSVGDDKGEDVITRFLSSEPLFTPVVPLTKFEVTVLEIIDNAPLLVKEKKMPPPAGIKLLA